MVDPDRMSGDDRGLRLTSPRDQQLCFHTWMDRGQSGLESPP